MTSTLERYFSSAVLMVWGVVLISFYFTGRVMSYLHPAFHIWLVISGGVMVLLAFTLLVTAGLAPSSPAVRGKKPAALLVSGFVLIGPLLMAVVVSPSEFGATAVLNRGFVQHINDLPAFSPPTEPPLPNQDGSIGESTPLDPSQYLPKNEKGQIKAETVDLLYASAEASMREDFEGKEVEITGQFLPAKTGNADGDRFHLVQMYVLCCAADARPVAVAVKAPAGTSFPEMTWLKVTGRATFPVEGGKRSPLVIADSVQEVDAPPETFTY